MKTFHERITTDLCITKAEINSHLQEVKLLVEDVAQYKTLIEKLEDMDLPLDVVTSQGLYNHLMNTGDVELAKWLAETYDSIKVKEV